MEINKRSNEKENSLQNYLTQICCFTFVVFWKLTFRSIHINLTPIKLF